MQVWMIKETRVQEWLITADPLKEIPGELDSPWFRPTSARVEVGADGNVECVTLTGPHRLPATKTKPARDAKSAGVRVFGKRDLLARATLPVVVRTLIAEAAE